MTQESALAVRALTVRDLLELPPVVDVETASRALGISRSHGYNLARSGTFPCTVLRAGRSFRVVTADLRRVLGVSHRAPAAESTAATVAA
ncbi:helix-turn-helix domain-containing protein [Streptomyces fuscigenes]|uniref:helix-turn-helix domain-containing protein n=1 Tax=Streptomyces fuscigenes TaxID=1528880 RepID=UPI001F45F703|nr:helix-turn-helix domain-containing protein [Streptomyces fuscigenes]MCF3960588.1 helix-turn-helix domain-containing protein [Streptomyces fuscigenes]